MTSPSTMASMGAGSTAAMAMPTVADQSFVTQAAYGGMAEAALGTMANRSAMSTAVRNFGQQMARDHSQVNQELLTLARAKGITPPNAPDPGRQSAAAALSRLWPPTLQQHTSMLRSMAIM